MLAAFFEAHPAFVVAGDVVEPVGTLDWRRELGPGERATAEVLGHVPGGHLSRASLQQALEAEGITAKRSATLASTSPILDHRGHDLWCLRGRPEEGAGTRVRGPS